MPNVVVTKLTLRKILKEHNEKSEESVEAVETQEWEEDAPALLLTLVNNIFYSMTSKAEIQQWTLRFGSYTTPMDFM